MEGESSRNGDHGDINLLSRVLCVKSFLSNEVDECNLGTFIGRIQSNWRIGESAKGTRDKFGSSDKLPIGKRREDRGSSSGKNYRGSFFALTKRERARIRDCAIPRISEPTQRNTFPCDYTTITIAVLQNTATVLILSQANTVLKRACNIAMQI
jgi:hypothetical protein